VSSNPSVLKIAVMADGRITVDGSPATMDSLHASLKRLAEQKGVVWYLS
jgi:biopolymer transport protein ExbD